MKILLTAFEPFGGESVNPALEAMKRIDEQIGEAQIVKIEVPTSFCRADKTVTQAIDVDNPDVVIMLGQAGGRTAITPEKIAVNFKAAKIPDNDGCMPFGEQIIKNAADNYESTLPIDDIVKNIKNTGVPAEISNSAGTYVCNCLFYSVMHYIVTSGKTIKAGFIHVPYEMSQVKNKPDVFAMTLDDIVKGLEVAIKTTIEQ